MTSLLVLKEYLKKFYGKNELYIMPIIKFLLAMVSLLMINITIGYKEQIDNFAVVLIVALMCSFLPSGFIIVFSALFILLHFYALGIELAVVALAIFLVMFLLYFRFAPKDALVVLITPLCFLLKIPYVVPIAVGLLCTPASMVSVGCGVIVYYLVAYVSENAAVMSTMEIEDTAVKFRMVIDSIVGNKAMLMTVIAFAVTIIVVYVVRRLSVDHSWTIAIVAGAMADTVILLIGDLLYDTQLSIVAVTIGTIVSILLAKALQFFAFNVDYSRTEKVQFEDDEYYYYVKAVPKMTVATPTKTVKKINSQRRTTSQGRPTPGNKQY